MPSVSILLPFHQAEPTLNEAVKSIVAQTFENWELILIDNNSSDKGTAIAERWVREDPRIKLIHEPKQGIAYALNTGIDIAKGKYLARMDADDYSYPARIENQVNFLEKNSGIGVVSCQVEFVSHMEKSEGYEWYVNWQNKLLSPEEHFLNRFIESPLAHPSVLFRRELVDKYGKYILHECPEDYELWLRWMSHDVLFAKLPEKLLLWNDDACRLSRTHTNYSTEAFTKVKCLYMSKWILKNIPPNRRIVACGTSKECQQKAKLLQAEGVIIHGFTDVRTRNIQGMNFIAAEKLTLPENYFLINLISRRGVNLEIRNFLNSRGYKEGKDYLLAG